MNDVKKDHSIGAGAGAVSGALAGAAVGAAGGPIGAAVGAVAGGVIGAKAGDAVAEAVNPTEYREYFEREYKNAPYYSAERSWNDYEPAYQYGYDTYGQHRGKRFEDVEPELQRNWDATRAQNNQRMEWNDARPAVRHGWDHIERAIPGDADRDGL